ncbi:ABC transporter substrate-binding protein [Paenibacillus alkalitolerans]|uniref:ABC transporter substrate-binding protein n=1 Tax=Paenibacillus alkalitolerans TaxID=2799335 RepID=UPI0018F49503|nr:extracellular solute-binding protein [Paenibacillus alkalitolerans]
MKRIVLKRAKLRIIAVLAFSMLVACSSGGAPKQVLAPLAEGEEVTIKVTYWDENIFYQHFGNLFIAQHPNIDIEVVSTRGLYSPDKDRSEAMKELIEKEQPDVLLLDDYLLEPLIKEGMLYELDPVMEQDGFALKGILPSAIEKIRRHGDGKLFGLAPTFSSYVIYYNKSLFEEHGVPLPKDGMTWEETLQLAERFPVDGSEEERVYGLEAFGGSTYYYFLRFGMDQGLSYLDTANKKVTLNTDSWKQAAETALRFQRSKAIYVEKPFNPKQGETYDNHLRRDPFLTGRLAMKMTGSWYMNQLKEAKDRFGEKSAYEWDVVTIPVHPDNPTETNYFNLSDIFSINAKSANLRAAWEFVKYVNSDTMAKITARSPIFGGLPVRTEHIRNDEGKHMEAFYSLKPSTKDTYADYGELPRSFFEESDKILPKHWDALVKEEVTIEEALRLMETELQAVLDKAIENVEKSGEESGEGSEAGA